MKLYDRRFIFTVLLMAAAGAAYLGSSEGIRLARESSFLFVIVLVGCLFALMVARIRRRGAVAAEKKAAIARLLAEVAVETDHAVSVAAALQACLEAVCFHTRWQIGHACLKVGGEARTTPAFSHLWSPNRALHSKGSAFDNFYDATESTPWEPSEGLSGCVIQKKTPAWIEDIAVSSVFTRTSAARAAGLRAAFAFPVIVGGEAVAVLEFFALNPAPCDHGLLTALFHLEALLARVIEREFRRQAIAESEYKFRVVAESTVEAIIIADGQGRITFWNPRAMALFGYPAADVIGQELTVILPPRYRDAYREALARFPAAGENRTFKLEALHRDGRIFPVAISLTGWVADGTQYFCGCIRDISERRRAKVAQQELTAKLHRSTGALRALRGNNRKIKLLSEISGLLHACANYDQIGDVVGRYGEQLMPHSAGALYLYNNSRDLLESRTGSWGSPPPQHKNFAVGDCWAVWLGKPYRVAIGRPELRCHHVQSAPAAVLCIPILAENEAYGVYFWQGSAAETGDSLADKQPLLVSLADQVAMALRNLQLKENLTNLSVHDPLTGLFNRRHLEESLDREVRQASCRVRPLALVMFDLDHFKRFNDTLGHPAGDALLRELSSHLALHIRSEDILCRYGGDEFLLIMPGTTAADAFRAAELLGQACKSLLIKHRNTGNEVTVSFGVAAFPEHGTTPAGLVTAADAALYRAKGEGRNRVMAAQPPSSLGAASLIPELENKNQLSRQARLESN